MRTTVTLDADTESAVRRLMRERGISFKQAVNDAIRSGTGAAPATRFETATESMGRPTIDLDRALQLAGALDDEDLAADIRTGR